MRAAKWNRLLLGLAVQLIARDVIRGGLPVMMPATVCSNPILFDFTRGLCRFVVEVAHDGVSTPPNCNGTVSRVWWNNTGQRTYYAHLPNTRLGPAVYQIRPGSTSDEIEPGGITTRSTLHAAGLDDRSDLLGGASGLDLNETPPQAGERLLNP
jgi:hypothetical protein